MTKPNASASMYVVRCADGTLYTGYAVDVEVRVATHNAGRGARYTRSRLPVELVAAAAFETRHEAMSAEWHFKQLDRAHKEALLARVAAGEDFARVLEEAFGPGTLASKTSPSKGDAPMKVSLNPDAEMVKAIKEGLKAKDGYCPCRVERTPENKCMCQEFRDQIADPNYEGFCHCMLYYKSLGE